MEVDGFARWPLSVILSSDGKHAYVTGLTGNAVNWYERNASTGALSYGGMSSRTESEWMEWTGPRA